MRPTDSPRRPIPNSYWVVPGRFAAGEYPGHWNAAEAEAKLMRMLDACIDHFIDLTQSRDNLRPYADTARQQADRNGLDVAYERHPIRDLGVPRTPEQMALTLDAIDNALDEGKTVYVHCWGGVGRTGTVVGCWLVRHGQTGDAALRQVGEWFQKMQKARPHSRSPETSEQRAYVRDWPEPPSQGELFTDSASKE